jgi:pSer/pThr/pTyr-binding forkhead associated (FHA) protein
MRLGPREQGLSLKVQPAKVLVLHKEPTKGRLDRFDGSTELGTWISIGRQSDSEVMVNDFSVSKSHARVRRNQEGFEVEDLGSNNGTMLNGTQLSAGVVVPLRSGDRIRFGRVQMRFYSIAALYRLLPNPSSGKGPSTT